MIGWAIWILFGGLVVLALLAPMESLRWWTKDGHEVSRLLNAPTVEELAAARTAVETARDSAADAGPNQFIVYLSGVGAVGGEGNSNSKTEQHFLRALEERLPGACAIGDVFPYSVQNRGMTQRLGGRIWARAARGRKRRRYSLLPYLINVRNALQVAVAIDPRYGPTYGLGLANEILKAILAKGYVPGSGTMVTVIGFSGGAQMSLNAAWFLESSGVPTQVISMGGVFANHSVFDRLHRFIHLWGTKDVLHHVGGVFSPGRWRIFRNSSYNRAKAEGRATTRCIGPMNHDAVKWYLDHRVTAPDGRSYFDTTVDAIVEFLEETPHTQPPAPSSAPGQQ